MTLNCFKIACKNIAKIHSKSSGDWKILNSGLNIQFWKYPILTQFCSFLTQTCRKEPIFKLFLAQTEVYPSKYFSSAGKKRCYTLTVAPFSGQLLFLSDVLSPAVNVSFKFKSKWPRIKVCQLRRRSSPAET